jgi:hypothetical protein
LKLSKMSFYRHAYSGAGAILPRACFLPSKANKTNKANIFAGSICCTKRTPPFRDVRFVHTTLTFKRSRHEAPKLLNGIHQRKPL